MPRVVIGEKRRVKFLTTSWEAPRMEVVFPEECPHCGGKVTRKRHFSTERATGMGRAARHTRVGFDVPVCGKVLSELVARLLVVLGVFWTVVFGLAALFSVRDGVPVAKLALVALALAGTVAALRAHTWIRVVTFDPGSVTFAVRRRDYARRLAALNPK